MCLISLQFQQKCNANNDFSVFAQTFFMKIYIIYFSKRKPSDLRKSKRSFFWKIVEWICLEQPSLPSHEASLIKIIDMSQKMRLNVRQWIKFTCTISMTFKNFMKYRKFPSWTKFCCIKHRFTWCKMIHKKTGKRYFCFVRNSILVNCWHFNM